MSSSSHFAKDHLPEDSDLVLVNRASLLRLTGATAVVVPDYTEAALLSQESALLGSCASSSSTSSSLPDARGPTKEQLAMLTHLPAGMMQLSQASGSNNTKHGRAHKKKHSQKTTPLSKEGAVVSKMFNEVASRPYPVFTQLEQTIRVTLTATNVNFFTTSMTAPTTASAQFSLSTFGGYSEYVSLFDQYLIRQVEVWLEPVGSQEATFSEMITAVDLDDVNTPTASLALKQGALIGLGSAGRYHRWVPHVAVAAYSGAFTSYGNTSPIWIDSASTNVQQFGFKVYSFTAPSTPIMYNLTSRAIVDFRSPGI